MKCYNTAILWWKLHLACGLPVRLRDRSLATFIHSLAKVLLLFNVYWVFTVCKVSIFRTFYFYSPSRPSCPLHQSPTLQFISFLASQQILKPVRQGMLKVGSGSGGNCHIPILELTTRRHHHKAALWSHAAWVTIPHWRFHATFLGGLASRREHTGTERGCFTDRGWSRSLSCGSHLLPGRGLKERSAFLRHYLKQRKSE